MLMLLSITPTSGGQDPIDDTVDQDPPTNTQ